MRANQIRIGGIYRAKVSNKLVDVRIKSEHPVKGWLGENLSTGREVWIRTAARLRHSSSEATVNR